jgi:hypothetical protein
LAGTISTRTLPDAYIKGDFFVKASVNDSATADFDCLFFLASIKYVMPIDVNNAVRAATKLEMLSITSVKFFSEFKLFLYIFQHLSDKLCIMVDDIVSANKL